MRKALVVGIDHYDHIGDLGGCVNDAYAVHSVMERNGDGTLNFDTRLMTATGPQQQVLRSDLRDAVEELFDDETDVALFYFSGHGYLEAAGGYLCATDTRTGNDGVSLAEVMTFANRSKARNKVIILDSCHSGIAGSNPITQQVTEIADGVTVLTASTARQAAMETGAGSGVFTDLLVDALSGAAANLVGAITPGSVYAHIDQSLGSWAQRPVFKTNVKTFVSLRDVAPPISLADLRMLTTVFPRPADHLPLDPSFEPERTDEQRADPTVPAPDPQNTATFALLQRYVRVNLVRPEGEDHMWHAAMHSKSCALTVLGQHYWNLVHERRI